MAENVYYLKCDHCNYRRWSDGSYESIQDLKEVVLCPKCHGPKKFKCNQCGFVIKAKRYVEPPTPEKHEFGK